MAQQAPNWFEGWTRTLLEDRLRRHQSETPLERLGMDWAADAMRARFASGVVDSLSATDVVNDITKEVQAAQLEPEATFYANKYALWIAGLLLGCRDGLHDWIGAGGQPLDQGRLSSERLRRLARRLAETSPHEESRRHTLDFARQVPSSADVAAVNQLRERITNRIRGGPNPEVLFTDSLLQLAGGYHEGVWMTVGVLSDPRNPMRGATP